MTKIISFANQKGGVGKSTLCIQTAFHLADRMGKRVLVIDLDAQGNTTSRLAPKVETKKGLEVALSGTKTSELFKKGIAVEPLACPYGIDLIWSPKNDPELFEIEAIDLRDSFNPRDNLKPILSNYDYVLIDCPPSLGRKLVAALILSTHVVSPIKLSGFAVEGVEGLMSTILAIKAGANTDLSIIGFVVNAMDRSKANANSFEELSNKIPEFMLKNKIMQRSPLDMATTLGQPIYEAKYSLVAQREVEAVINEILERTKG